MENSPWCKMASQNSLDNQLRLIDANAPFFIFQDAEVTNWSKIPFNDFQQHDQLDKFKTQQITDQFEIYVGQVKALGYDAISLDDLVHLVVASRHNQVNQTLVRQYQSWFKTLISLAKKNQLQVFITADLYSFEADSLYDQAGPDVLAEFFKQDLIQLCKIFPQIDGIILRMGESDGQDVDSNFRSQLKIKTPNQLNYLLQQILPILESQNRRLILRTWAVGAYQIGDLNWNVSTLSRVLANVNSSALILSAKPGGSDFFRYLDLQTNAEQANLSFIVELQAKLEYEGMGYIPHYQGHRLLKVLQAAKSRPNFMGVSVWAQTGGWGRIKQLFLTKNSSIWTELSAMTIIYILEIGRPGLYWAVDRWINKHGYSFKARNFLTWLFKLERLSYLGWYIPEFAATPRYLLRAKIPTLLWIYWDELTINGLIGEFVRSNIRRPKIAINQGYRAAKLARQLAVELVNYDKSLFAEAKLLSRFYLLLALHRHVWLGGQSNGIKLLASYSEFIISTYPELIGFKYMPIKSSGSFLVRIANILIRNQPKYRLVDVWLFSLPGKFLVRNLLRFSKLEQKVNLGKAMSVSALID